MNEYEDAVKSEDANDATHVVGFDEKVGESERRSHKRHHVIGQKHQRLLEESSRQSRL